MEIFNKSRGHQVRPLSEFAFCTFFPSEHRDAFKATSDARTLCGCVRVFVLLLNLDQLTVKSQMCRVVLSRSDMIAPALTYRQELFVIDF